MIGTEVQLSYLERYLPVSDFAFEHGGYMLVEYSRLENSRDTQRVDCSIHLVMGSYIRRLIGQMDHIQLSLTDRRGVYTVASGDFEPVQVVLHPLRMYNTNAPFSDEQWAIAAVGTDNMLFEMSRSVRNGIVQSSAVALIIGVALLAITVRLLVRPLISMAS